MGTTGTDLAASHRLLLHHPWRRFREFEDWKLKWGGLPVGLMGKTFWSTKTVRLAEGMSQAERRCTIAHETAHIIRGPVSADQVLREELQVDRLVGRLLIPSVAAVADAMVWARGDLEVTAEELWVDDYLLQVRLSGLMGAEREFMHDRMGEVWLR